MTADLESARIRSLPADAFYIADFLSDEEEQSLLNKINTAPLPRWTHLSHRRLQTWPSALSQSNTLIASPLPPWLITPIITPRFDALSIFTDAPHRAPNHVLVNEYRPGQGIMPHEDGAAYYPLVATVSLGAAVVLDLYPKGCDRGDGQGQGQGEGEGEYPESGSDDHDGREEQPRTKPQYRILQERRSLLVTRGKIYTEFLHGIAETTKDQKLGPETVCNWGLLREPECFREGWFERKTRVSLTYRDVLKVAKLGNTMKFLGRGR